MNLDVYTEEMAKSVWDKAFFMDKIPGAKCVIDFGCADGAMIRYLAPLFPTTTFIGYDINEELISRASWTAPFHANVHFFMHIEDMIEFVLNIKNFKSHEICINFSSVLHEVYSTTGGLYDIVQLQQTLRPKYITIRDMYYDEPPLKFSALGKEMKIIEKIEENHKLAYYAKEFVNKFGFLKTWDNVVHLLMKLQWVDNGWEDELKEDYFSWTIDKFLTAFDDKYEITFENRYQLPYLCEKWEEEYGWHNPEIHTHAQFILRRVY